jgi:NNP family nitrate/nitrite transporter-like MFS transporter
VLFMSTFAFTVCFAVWLFYGALIKYLTKAGLFQFSPSEIGLLIAAPILTGSVLRLPAGVLTDRYGGRPVFVSTLLVSALGVASVALANSFWGFLFAGLCFGISGASFAVGIAFTATWFPQEKQGTALGIFGAGNAGAGITLTCVPKMIEWATEGGAHPEAWRSVPLMYAGFVALTAVAFWLLTENRVADARTHKTLAERMAPLKNVQVWRFGLYYFLVFGAFVGLSGWLMKYYVDVYEISLATAGVLATCFSLPSGVIRAIGGYLSDKMGARAVMYWVLGTCAAGTIALCLPMGIVPFTILVVFVGISMGIGKAAVYKHIPVYFPREVGVVGGMVGVIGGLGGFACPLVFGWLLGATRDAAHPTGLWTTAWMFLAVVSVASLVWMHLAIRGIERRRASLPPPVVAVPAE